MQRRVATALVVMCALSTACSDDSSPTRVVRATGSNEAAGSGEETASVASDTSASTSGPGSSRPGTASAPESRPATTAAATASSALSDATAQRASAPSGPDAPLQFARVDDPLLEPERRGGRFATLDAIDGHGFVIGGHTVAADGSARPRVWRSDDGAEWTSDELPLAGSGANVTASVPVLDRLLLFGADPLAGQPVAWSIASTGEIDSITGPAGATAWSVVAAQPFDDGALLWGESAPSTAGAPVFAVLSADGSTWRQADELNALLAGHGARKVIDVASGAAGSAALVETDRGHFLVLVDSGDGWEAWVLDSAEVHLGGVDASDGVRLAGALITRRGAVPATFEPGRRGEWAPTRVDVVSDDRNAGFQSSTGDRLHDSFVGGRVLTGNVSAAEILAVPGGGGTWLEAAYPDKVSGPAQPVIAEVVRSGGVTLAIAGDRPALLRLDRFAVTPVSDDDFPAGASVPSASGLVATGDTIAFPGAYTSVPAGTGAQRRSWARWLVDAGGDVSVSRSDDDEQLELADLAVNRDGTMIGVGYEGFVPANFEDFIQPYEFVDIDGDVAPRSVGGDDRTVRFHHVADAGTAVVAAGAVFDDRGRLDPVFFRRVSEGTWALAPTPPPTRAERASNVDLVDMCPLPGAGAVLFARYSGADTYRAYVTGDGATWQGFAPNELAGERVSLVGCAAGPEHVLVFGSVDGRSRLWRTVDGQRFDAVAVLSGGRIVDAAADEDGGIWILAGNGAVIELDADGSHRRTSTVPEDQLRSPAGPAEVTDIAVTPNRVAILGSWNGGIGLWTADRG